MINNLIQSLNQYENEHNKTVYIFLKILIIILKK